MPKIQAPKKPSRGPCEDEIDKHKHMPAETPVPITIPTPVKVPQKV